MAELDRKSGEWKADKTLQESLAFVDRLQFGTVEYNAVSDFIDLERLEDDLESAQVGNTNMIEVEIAVARHDIKQNKSRVNGYGAAYQNITDMYNDLGEVAASDAREMFPNKDLDQGVHIIGKLSEFTTQAWVAVCVKRGEL